MREEIERILQLVESGTLSRAQATEMIAALSEPPQPDAGAPPKRRVTIEVERGDGDGENRRNRRRHRNRHRTGKRHEFDFDAAFEELGEALEEEVEQAIDLGAKRLHEALKRSVEIGPDAWGDAMFAKTDAPDGTDFVCEDNQIVVSQIRDVRLIRAEFSRNVLNAAGIRDFEIGDGTFTDNALRGSSLRHVLIEHGEVTGNQINGGQLSRLTLGRAQLTGNHFNGAQVRDLGIADSGIAESRFNGAKLRSVVLKADSRIKRLKLNGVWARSWLVNGSVMNEVTFKGVRIDGFVMNHAGLENCVFEKSDGYRSRNRNMLEIRDFGLEHAVLKNCRFVDCAFDRTTFQGLTVDGLTFRDVDFSNRTFTTADALRALATERDVA